MTSLQTIPAEASAEHTHPQWMMWLTAAVLGVVFFYLGHNLRISTIEGWTPWVDSTGTFHSKNTTFRGVVYGTVALLGMYCLYRTQNRMPAFNGLSLAVIGFVAWCSLSLLWSHDVRLTLIRLGVLGITCVAAYGISRAIAPSQWIPLAVTVMGAYLLIGIAAEVMQGTFRPWAAGYRFSGTVHPNEQGANMALFSLGAYCQLRWKSDRRLLWSLLFAAGVGFLLLTKSRSGCAGIVAAIALLESVIAPSWKPVLVGLTIGWVACVSGFLATVAGVDLSREITQAAYLGRQEESEGLTGRIPLWTAVMPFARAKIMTGYGFESFWTGKHIEHVKSIIYWTARDAHSLYLNMVLSVGVIGLGLFLLMIFTALLNSAQQFRFTIEPGYAFLCGIMISMLARGTLEANTGLPGFSLLLICCGVSSMAFVPSQQAVFVPARERLHLPVSFVERRATVS